MACLSPGPLCAMCLLCPVPGYLVGRGEVRAGRGVLKPSLSSLLSCRSCCGAPEGRGIFFLICSRATPRLKGSLAFPGEYMVGWACAVHGATQTEVQGAVGYL